MFAQSPFFSPTFFLPNSLFQAEIENITASIRNAQENIAKLKPNESGQLASAFAAARFIISLVKALQGFSSLTGFTLVVTSYNRPNLFLFQVIQML